MTTCRPNRSVRHALCPLILLAVGGCAGPFDGVRTVGPQRADVSALMAVLVATPVTTFGDAFTGYTVYVHDGVHTNGRPGSDGRRDWVHTATNPRYEFLGVTADVEAYATVDAASVAFQDAAKTAQRLGGVAFGGGGTDRYAITDVQEVLGQFGDRTEQYASDVFVQRGNLLISIRSQSDPGDGSDKVAVINDVAARLARLPGPATSRP